MTAVSIGKYTTSSPLPDPIMPTQNPIIKTDTRNWNTNATMDLAYAWSSVMGGAVPTGEVGSTRTWERFKLIYDIEK